MEKEGMAWRDVWHYDMLKIRRDFIHYIFEIEIGHKHHLVKFREKDQV